MREPTPRWASTIRTEIRMQARSRTLAVIAVAMLAPAATAAAHRAVTTNVCKLVPAKAVTAIAGTSTCTNAAATKGPGSTLYEGNWVGTTSTAPRVQVTIAVYSDTGVLQLAKHNLKQGLPGPPKAVTGIGSGAFVATGAASTGIHLDVGKYIAYIVVNTTGKAVPVASVEALGKAVAGRL